MPERGWRSINCGQKSRAGGIGTENCYEMAPSSVHAPLHPRCLLVGCKINLDG